jgi:hypothetical protein
MNIKNLKKFFAVLLITALLFPVTNCAKLVTHIEGLIGTTCRNFSVIWSLIMVLPGDDNILFTLSLALGSLIFQLIPSLPITICLLLLEKSFKKQFMQRKYLFWLSWLLIGVVFYATNYFLSYFHPSLAME